MSETPTAAATTTEIAMRDMTSLLHLLLCATDENTRAKCGNALIASPEAPIKFATRKMTSVGAQEGIPRIFGLCCFLDTNTRLSQPKIPFESEEPVPVPLISQMCDELKRPLNETHARPITTDYEPRVYRPTQ